MNAIIGRLLQNIPSAYDTKAYDAASLVITGPAGSSITLSDLTLYIATPVLSVTIDLHGQTVSQVAALMPSGITATVSQDGPAELLLYSDGSGAVPSGQLPVALTIATSPMWQLLAAISRELTNRERNIATSFGQVNIRTAVGMWLDWWGASLGISRVPNEPDTLYVRRLIGQTLAPNVNNVAIEQLFFNLGYDVSIADTLPGQFQATVNYPSNPPDGFIYSMAQIASIIDDVKASGIIAAIYFLASIVDIGISLSDSVTVTTPGGLAIANLSKCGECTCAQ